MPAVINTNLLSLNAQRHDRTAQSSLAPSMQRLSSGLRVNSARADAAGLAIGGRAGISPAGEGFTEVQPAIGHRQQHLPRAAEHAVEDQAALQRCVAEQQRQRVVHVDLARFGQHLAGMPDSKVIAPALAAIALRSGTESTAMTLAAPRRNALRIANWATGPQPQTATTERPGTMPQFSAA